MNGEDKPKRTARELAREIVEWARAGSTLIIKDEEWYIEWPVIVDDIRPDVVVE